MKIFTKHKKKLGSDGFGHIELLMVVVVIAAVVGVGSYVYSKDHTSHAGSWTKVGTVYLGKVNFKVYGCAYYPPESYSNVVQIKGMATASTANSPGTSYTFKENFNNDQATTNDWIHNSSAPVSLFSYYGYGSTKVKYSVTYAPKSVTSSISTQYYDLTNCR